MKLTKYDNMKFNKYDKFVAYRIANQRITSDKVVNGVFMLGQIPDDPDIPDGYALNWYVIGEANTIIEAKEILFKLRAACMKKYGVKYCPIYSPGGYAYEGSY